MFQQSSAFPHTARKSQAWCVRNLQMVWTQYFVPLNSPDLNPTDYFVWGVVGSKANEHRVASRDTPKHQITEVTDSIDKEGWHVRARASGPVSRRSLIGRVITLVHTWLKIGVVMMLRCYNAVFRYIFLSMTFLTCWQIFPDYAAPPCMVLVFSTDRCALPFNLSY